MLAVPLDGGARATRGAARAALASRGNGGNALADLDLLPLAALPAQGQKSARAPRQTADGSARRRASRVVGKPVFHVAAVNVGFEGGSIVGISGWKKVKMRRRAKREARGGKIVFMPQQAW
mgnify:CR=1 FL=1